MASIPDVQTKSSSSSLSQPTNIQSEPTQETEPQTATIESAHESTPSATQTNDIEIETENKAEDAQDSVSDGVKACDDTRYRKYFKMLQFGVPAPAVKLKMANEGFDPNVLE